MDNKHIWVAIIAGGQGTRLFPISHANRPKQFCQLDANNTFIQAVIKNFTGLGFKPSQFVIITTNDNQTELAKEQALPRGVLSQNIYQIDPTLGYSAAMYMAAEFVSSHDKNAVIINTPSDQFIDATSDEFRETMKIAVEEAENDNAVIVGVKVNDLVVATGCGHALYEDSESKCSTVTGFVEKPNKKEADKIMRQGNSACNTGINVWKTSTLIKAINKRDIKGMPTDEMMRRLGKLRIAVGTFKWYDCGTLKSLYEISKKTPNHKNASLGPGKFERVSCRNSLFYAGEGMELQVTGAEDDAVVFTIIKGKPIIVIAKLKDSQRIKDLAEDYIRHEAFLTDDFSFGARNNMVLGSNISDDLIVGFVGVKNYVVYAHKESDGTLSAVVSRPLTK